MEQSIPIEHRYTADAGFAARMARALFRFGLSRPLVVVLLALIVLITSLGGVVVANSLEFVLVGALCGLLVGVLIDVLVAVLTFEKTRRRVAVIAPAGAEYGVGLGESAIRVIAPMSTAEVAYGAFQSAERRGEFVFLRHRSSRLFTVLAAELFPGDALQRLRERIRSA